MASHVWLGARPWVVLLVGVGCAGAWLPRAAADPTAVERRGGSLYPLGDTAIEMTRESIVVRGCWRFDVNVELVNQGEDVEVDVAFPEYFNIERALDGGIAGRESLISKLRLEVAGKPVALTQKVVVDGELEDFARRFGPCAQCEDSCLDDCNGQCGACDGDDEEAYDCEVCRNDCASTCRDCCHEEIEHYGPYGVVRPGSELGIDALHVAHIAFPAKQAVSLRYTFEMSCEDYTTDVTTRPLDYMLVTGAFWRGPIGVIDIDVELPGRPVHHRDRPMTMSLPGGRVEHVGKAYYVRAHLESYEPTQDLHIDASYETRPRRYLPEACDGVFEDDLAGVSVETLRACRDGVRARHGLPIVPVETIPPEWQTTPLDPQSTAYWADPSATEAALSKDERALVKRLEAELARRTSP